MNQVIRYQYQYIVWSIYVIATYLSLIAQIWLTILQIIPMNATWYLSLLWLVMLFAGGVFAPKGEK